MIKLALIVPGKSQNLHFEKQKWVMLFCFEQYIYLSLRVCVDSKKN